jgi:hypothetical protein
LVIQGTIWIQAGDIRPSQVIMVCQDNADSTDNEDRIDAILIDLSKDFDFVPHDRLLMKIAISGVDSRVVPWVRESFWVARRE